MLARCLCLYLSVFRQQTIVLFVIFKLDCAHCNPRVAASDFFFVFKNLTQPLVGMLKIKKIGRDYTQTLS